VRRYRLACSPLLLGFAVAGMPSLRAATVTTTITGIVASGTDSTGVFGFAAGTDMTNQAFTLIYTFDDTKGSQSVTNCSSKPCSSSITSTATSNPGMAVLKIGSGSWTFGTLPSATSSVMRAVPPAGDQIQYSVKDDGGQTDTISSFIDPALGTVLTTDYNWEDALSNSDLASLQAPFTVNTGSQLATGWLIPQDITVSGPEASPPSASEAPKSLGDCPVCAYNASHPGVGGRTMTVT